MKVKSFAPLVCLGTFLMAHSLLLAQDPESGATKQCKSRSIQTGGCVNDPNDCKGQECTQQSWDASKCDGLIYWWCEVKTQPTNVVVRTGNCTLSYNGCGCSGSDSTVSLMKSRC